MLVSKGLARAPASADGRRALADEVVGGALPQFDALMREYCYQRNQEFLRTNSIDLDAAALDGPSPSDLSAWSRHARAVDGELVEPQPGGFYGGWITSRVVGPFKGAPGTRGW